MRKLAVFVLGAAITGLVSVYVIGGALAAPQSRKVGDPPPHLPVETVSIMREGGVPVSGWFVSGESQKPGVLLLHGVWSDRREMIGRAQFLFDAGYSVLLIDMQAHGETPGENITFGYLESNDVHSALGYLRTRVHGRRVGVIGVSLGGAAALLGKSPVDADAVILEAVYSSIENAVRNRISNLFGEFGRYLAPLLTWQIEPRLGVPLESLSPLSAIRELNAPVMIVAGTEDQHTLSQESQELYSQAGEPKQLWMVEGARHQNFHQYSKEAYESRVLEFFGQYLRAHSA